jgi:hypothetical protein
MDFAWFYMLILKLTISHYQSGGDFFPCRMGIAYQYDLRGPTNSRTNIIPSFDEVKSFLSAASVNECLNRRTCADVVLRNGSGGPPSI